MQNSSPDGTPLAGGLGTYRLDPPGPYLVGRDAESGLVVPDVRVSRAHAVIEADGGGWWLRDAGSAGGTYVDGARVDVRAFDGPTDVRLGHPVDGPRLRVTVDGAAPGSLLVEVVHAFTEPPQGTEDAGSAAEVASSATGSVALDVDRIGVTTPEGTRLLSEISFMARRGDLVAVVGPTGAGKSTLLRALTGVLPPEPGTVRVMGRDLYRHFDEVRDQLGYVPQDDIVHHQLTIEQALGFAAELRFPVLSEPAERAGRIAAVLRDLGLREHAAKPISRLSGGQRKRVSVALELLTEPSLLLLDEPTSGLDPGYEQSIMQLLRRLADDDRTVLVVTHSVASLDLCDNVLFLETGGRVAYCGPPDRALAHFGAADYPAVFRALEAAGRVRESSSDGGSTQAAGTGRRDVQPPPVPLVRRARQELVKQFRVLLRRSLAVLVADRRNVAVLAGAALLTAGLLVALVGPGGFDHQEDLPRENARTLVGGLVISGAVFGAANGVREIVKETAIYRRERAAGLDRWPYLLSKLAVMGGVTVAQCILLVAIGTVGAGGPGRGSLLGWGHGELTAGVAAAALATLAVGLAVSAVVSSSEKAMALVPIFFVLSWLLSGVALDLQDKPVLREVALLAPANWGTAAAAGTVDLSGLEMCGEPAAQVGEADEGGGADPGPASGGAAGSEDGVTSPDNPVAGGQGSDAVDSEPVSTGSEASEAVSDGPDPVACNARWRAGVGPWLTAWAGLLGLTAGSLAVADWALARREPLPQHRRDHVFARLARAAHQRITARKAGR